jgi:hypothetical protein
MNTKLKSKLTPIMLMFGIACAIRIMAATSGPCDNNASYSQTTAVCTDANGIPLGTDVSCTDKSYTVPIGCTAKDTVPNNTCVPDSCGICYCTETSGYCYGGVCDGSGGSTTYQVLSPFNGSTCVPKKRTVQCSGG